MNAAQQIAFTKRTNYVTPTQVESGNGIELEASIIHKESKTLHVLQALHTTVMHLVSQPFLRGTWHSNVLHSLNCVPKKPSTAKTILLFSYIL